MAPNSEKVRHLRYESLRKRLKKEKNWPLQYRHKIIGKNVESFHIEIKVLEEMFPRMNMLESNTSKNGTYLSLTYELRALHVDEIIELWIESEKIKDIVTIF